MLVRDAMNTDVVTAEPGTPIGQVARRMADADVGAVVIVEGGKPVGIVTDRDLVVEHLAKGHTEEHPVREAMSGGGPLARLVTIAPDLDLLKGSPGTGAAQGGAPTGRGGPPCGAAVRRRFAKQPPHGARRVAGRGREGGGMSAGAAAASGGGPPFSGARPAARRAVGRGAGARRPAPGVRWRGPSGSGPVRPPRAGAATR